MVGRTTFVIANAWGPSAKPIKILVLEDGSIREAPARELFGARRQLTRACTICNLRKVVWPLQPHDQNPRIRETKH